MTARKLRIVESHVVVRNAFTRLPFRFGVDHLPEAECEMAIIRHPELYERISGTGFLRVENGNLNLRSLQVPELGVVDFPDLDVGIPEVDWRFEMLEREV